MVDFGAEFYKAKDAFVEAVQNVSRKRLTDRNGVLRGTAKVNGYVTFIHDDPKDDLYGTVDVQEYGYTEEEYPEGLHEGVLLSTVPDDDKGFYIVPLLLSDVVIVTEPVSPFREFIFSYSRVNIVHFHGHEQITIGVDEINKEQKIEDLESIADLKNSGNSSITQYEKDKIVHTVIKNNDVACFVSLDDTGHVRISGKNITVDAEEKVMINNAKTVDIKAKQGITLDAKSIQLNNGSEKMVLGNKLVSQLQSLCSAISSLTVTTPSGPFPIDPASQAKLANISGQLANILSQKSTLD